MSSLIDRTRARSTQRARSRTSGRQDVPSDSSPSPRSRVESVEKSRNGREPGLHGQRLRAPSDEDSGPSPHQRTARPAKMLGHPGTRPWKLSPVIAAKWLRSSCAFFLVSV